MFESLHVKSLVVLVRGPLWTFPVKSSRDQWDFQPADGAYSLRRFRQQSGLEEIQDCLRQTVADTRLLRYRPAMSSPTACRLRRGKCRFVPRGTPDPPWKP